MIDTKPFGFALGGKLEHQTMRCLEHRFVLHAQCSEMVDVEKTAIVDLVGGHAPVSDTVRLRLQERVQGGEAFALTGRAVELADGSVDSLGKWRMLAHQLRQSALMQLFVTLPFGNLSRSRLVTPWQMAKGGDETAKLAGGGRRQRIARRLQRAIENRGVFARIDGQPMLVVTNGKCACLCFVDELQLTSLEHAAIVIAKDRHEHLAH